VFRNIGALHKVECFGIHSGFEFLGENVNLRPGKVWQAASMIQVEVREHDMPNILCGETQPQDLSGDCLFQVAGQSNRGSKQPYKGCWVRIVSESQTRVNQDKPIVRLDEQAVANTNAAWEFGVHRSAV
jgi:hypothetical protein